MIVTIGEVILRPPELSDVEELYLQKNDPAVTRELGGFSKGYSRQGITDWIAYHRSTANELLLVIAHAGTNKCLGHIGLYQIDHRIGQAEFAIMVGDTSSHRRGVGKGTSRFMLQYGFEQLKLNRIALQVLESNAGARALYTSLGFSEEGRLRQGQFRDGQYVDVMLMSLLAQEYLSEQRG